MGHMACRMPAPKMMIQNNMVEVIIGYEVYIMVEGKQSVRGYFANWCGTMNLGDHTGQTCMGSLWMFGAKLFWITSWILFLVHFNTMFRVLESRADTFTLRYFVPWGSFRRSINFTLGFDCWCGTAKGHVPSLAIIWSWNVAPFSTGPKIPGFMQTLDVYHVYCALISTHTHVPIIHPQVTDVLKSCAPWAVCVNIYSIKFIK